MQIRHKVAKHLRSMNSPNIRRANHLNPSLSQLPRIRNPFISQHIKFRHSNNMRWQTLQLSKGSMIWPSEGIDLSFFRGSVVVSCKCAHARLGEETVVLHGALEVVLQQPCSRLVPAVADVWRDGEDAAYFMEPAFAFGFKTCRENQIGSAAFAGQEEAL